MNTTYNILMIALLVVPLLALLGVIWTSSRRNKRNGLTR